MNHGGKCKGKIINAIEESKELKEDTDSPMNLKDISVNAWMMLKKRYSSHISSKSWGWGHTG